MHLSEPTCTVAVNTNLVPTPIANKIRNKELHKDASVYKVQAHDTENTFSRSGIPFVRGRHALNKHANYLIMIIYRQICFPIPAML